MARHRYALFVLFILIIAPSARGDLGALTSEGGAAYRSGLKGMKGETGALTEEQMVQKIYQVKSSQAKQAEIEALHEKLTESGGEPENGLQNNPPTRQSGEEAAEEPAGGEESSIENANGEETPTGGEPPGEIGDNEKPAGESAAGPSPEEEAVEAMLGAGAFAAGMGMLESAEAGPTVQPVDVNSSPNSTDPSNPNGPPGDTTGNGTNPNDPTNAFSNSNLVAGASAAGSPPAIGNSVPAQRQVLDLGKLR